MQRYNPVIAPTHDSSSDDPRKKASTRKMGRAGQAKAKQSRGRLGCAMKNQEKRKMDNGRAAKVTMGQIDFGPLIEIEKVSQFIYS
jgi:hypothetical protein